MKITKHKYRPASPDSPTIRTEEAADILDVSVTILKKMIKNGEIEAKCIKRYERSCWYIDRASVMTVKGKMEAKATEAAKNN